MQHDATSCSENITCNKSKAQCPTHLSEEDCQQHNRQDYAENEHQTEALVASRLLIPRSLAILDVCLACVVSNILDIVRNRPQLLALFCDNVRNLAEKHIQVANTLFDIANFLFTLDEKSLVKVHLILGRQLRQFLSL